MVVRLFGRKTCRIGNIVVYVSASAEAETKEEAEKILEEKLEEKEREAWKEIEERQKRCEHEFEKVWCNINQTYKLVCVKCGYTKVRGIFSDDFLEAYQKGLTSVPRW